MFKRMTILMAATLVLGCGGGGGPANPAPAGPAITVMPASQAVLVGQTATFAIQCSGSGLTYSWTDPTGTVLSQQPAYTTPPATLADNGIYYTATVSNAAGSVRASAALQVAAAPTVPVILTQPADATVAQGSYAIFAVESAGIPTPEVQWYRNGAAIPAATASVYYLDAPAADLDGSVYHAVASTPAGTATSQDATLHVAATPGFSLQPADTTVPCGSRVAMTASVPGLSGIQWLINGVPFDYGTSTAVLAGTSTAVTVSGNSYVGTSATLSFIAPGAPAAFLVQARAYPVQAAVPPTGFTATSAAATLTVVPAATAPAVLSVQGILLDQGIQLPDGSIPLVANRAGLLRVVCKASSPNGLAPAVAVTVLVPGQAPALLSIAAPCAGVPTAPDPAAFPSQTWDVMLPADQVQPGTQVLVTLDPGGQEAAFPAWTLSCTPVPDLAIEFVPLALAGAAPAVSPADAQGFAQEITRIHPLGRVTATVGAPFTPSVPDLATAANVCQCLADLEAKRIADGSLQTYYQGLWQQGLDVPYGGLALMGSPGSSANRSSLAAFGVPSINAHELGHNLGLQHAPCGLPPDPDPDFPYSGAAIGLGQPVDITGPGLMPSDLGANMLRDIMSYCGAYWISDYNYRKLFNALTGPAAGAAAQAPAPCLLVSGTRKGDGAWTLHPAFSLNTCPTADAGSGLRIELLDGDRVVATQFIAPAQVADSDRFHFTAAIPAPGPVTAIRVTHQGRTSLLTGLQGSPMAPVLTLLSRGTAHLSWNHAAHAAAMVRDEATGKVVAILGAEVQDLPVVEGRSYRVDLSHNLGSVAHPGILPR